MSVLASIPRLVRTLRHVRPGQFFAQAMHPLIGIRSPRRGPAQPPQWRVRRATVPFLPAPSHARLDADGAIHLLNRQLDASPEIDWGFADEGPLFAYHLHQFEYVRPGAMAGPEQSHAASRLMWMLDWIERHTQGVGWDPHPICLRTLTWTRLLLTEGAVGPDAEQDRVIRSSMARQFDALDRNIEVRLQANHLLTNWMGVVLGGLLFEGRAAERWLRRSDRLVTELRSQIELDGAHEERSPMYHALLLENVLDLLNVARAAGPCAPADLTETLEDTARRMLGALEVWTLPDGEIALFGDSALGIAATPHALCEYAAALGLSPTPPSQPGVLDAAGFVRLEEGPFSVLVSVAGPSPSHQPGHAHCDALAFELSHGNERVVCDTGVYEYVAGERRWLSRSTLSHATLAVGGAEQAEIWSSHRVGGRPRVTVHELQPGLRVEASCVGWATPAQSHRRLVFRRAGEIVVEDRLEGDAASVRSTLPLAPGIECELMPGLEVGGQARLRLPSGQCLIFDLTAGLRWRMERAPSYSEFGRERERAVLVGEAEKGAFQVGRLAIREA